MLSYRLITSGKNQRREYLTANRSPLFQNLPERDYTQGQKASYSKFLSERLPQLLTSYFPLELSDYNNSAIINVEGLKFQEPKIKKNIKGKEVEEEMSEKYARENSLTWSYLTTFVWKVAWSCRKMPIQLIVKNSKKVEKDEVEPVDLSNCHQCGGNFSIKKAGCIFFSYQGWEEKFCSVECCKEWVKKNNPISDLKKIITQWVEESFKIGKFTCKKKSFSSKELNSLLTETQKQLQELQKEEQEKVRENSIWRLTNKIERLEQNQYQEWEIKEIERQTKKQEEKNKENEKLKIVIEILEQTEEKILISFHCQQGQRVNFCHLPKMNRQGNFIINGHNKVVIFQSVRAPNIYYFSKPEGGFFGEIIPFKGPWINISYNIKKPLSIEIKFLNSGLVVDLLSILKTFAVSPEILETLFDKESLNIESYQEVKELEIGIKSLPRFLFISQEGNHYFNIGRLGRKKCQKKMDLVQQLRGQTLAEDLLDDKGKILVKKNAVFEKKNLQLLQEALQKKKIKGLTIPHSTNDLYIVKIKSPQKPEKIISVVGTEELSAEKTYFDLADLICAVSVYVNLHHGLGNLEKQEDKDKLENQITRQAGDLVYSIFENKLGGFLQNLGSQYITNYLSQLKKVNLLKIPNLDDFDGLIKNFFNNSALARLQNQNNPLSIISDGLVSSVMGLGGFSSANTTLAARNINSSFAGRYDPIETPEGQRVGLVHRLAIEAGINEYGQLTTFFYPVRDGVIINELTALSSEEAKNKYIAHFNTRIDEKNRIVEKILLALYQENFVWVSKEKIDFIYNSFYSLNSTTSATIPFFNHNDATRMLMATNMQRQAVTILKSQVPLVATGIESNLLKNSPLTINSEEKGIVEYVDSQQIIIKEKSQKNTYELEQMVVSNKNVLNFSFPLVKKGEKVEKGQMIACGNYANNGELSLGYNLRVAYLCWNGYNYEDAIIVSERLIKEDILTSFFVKEHVIVRYNTPYGPEIFTSSLPHIEKSQLSHLGKDGIVKVGSQVKGNDILVGKLTPEPEQSKKSEEESFLTNILKEILEEKTQKYTNSSLRLPAEESGVVCEVRKKKFTKSKHDLELVEICIVQKRKIEAGDKLTTRFGNKGVVAKIIPEIDMPFDETGQTIDIIFNPLGVPTRMNIGQLLEIVLSLAAHKLDIKLLSRPFSSYSPETIKEIIQEAKIKNYGTQKLFDGQTGLPFQQDVYSGYLYTIKLNHMAVDKFHARNVGPYSLIYQQPVKGRSQGGGQRFGEMEIWGLWAHGAPFNINELMGAKSDDIQKRNLLQSSLLFNDRWVDLSSIQSESFNLLIQYLRGIGFDLQAFDYQEKEIDFYESFSRKSPKK